MLSAFFAPLLKYIVGGLLFLNVILGVAWQIELRHARKSDARIVELTELRKSDHAAYEAAQIQAAEQNKAEVLAKEQQYKRNNDEAVANLTARLERLRRELRPQTGADQGSAGKPGSPAPFDPSGAADSSRVCIPTSKLLLGAENEERHDRLIDLIERQLGIDPNGGRVNAYCARCFLARPANVPFNINSPAAISGMARMRSASSSLLICAGMCP